MKPGILGLRVLGRDRGMLATLGPAFTALGDAAPCSQGCSGPRPAVLPCVRLTVRMSKRLPLLRMKSCRSFSVVQLSISMR